MKLKQFKAGLLILAVGAFTASCEPENVEVNSNETNLDLKNSKHSLEKGNFDIGSPDLESLAVESTLSLTDENLRDYIIGKNAVEPSDCAPTEFVAVQRKYQQPVINDLYALFGPDQYASIFYLYMDLNFYSAYFDTSEDQYFGENGKKTNLIKKTQKDMERFWNMPNEIRINGQHTATLNDREKLADVYEIVGTNITTREQAYAAADQILYFNTFSDHLPDNPFFAIDGFATSANLIVLGDGLVQMVSEAGVEEDIVWTGILAHEWAHQVQFNNYGDWYPTGAADNAPEATRYTELEADFFAAYYMTHKKGATYNWKRVEEFFTLFFQIGDCSFSANGHHGTPAQRMDAARLGYELANGAHKQGHILTEQELHEIFVEQIQEVIPAPSTTK